jgi:uncharacterized protein (TIRG00374 family)
MPNVKTILWRYGLPIILIGAMLSHLNLADLLAQLKQFDGIYWAGTVLCIFAQTMLNTWRWQLLMNLQSHRLHFDESVRINFLSQAANYLFISSISGVVVRVAMVLRHGISLGRAIGANVVDRILAIITLVFLVVLSIPFLLGLTNTDFVLPIVVALMLIAAIAVVALGMVWVTGMQRLRIPFQRKIRAVLAYGRHLLRQPKIVAVNLALSMFGQLLFFIGSISMAKALGIDVSYTALLTLLPIISLVASLPLTVGGWGVREGAFIYALSLIGVGMEQAFMLSVQVGLAGIAATLLMGLPWGWQLQPLRKIGTAKANSAS